VNNDFSNLDIETIKEMLVGRKSPPPNTLRNRLVSHFKEQTGSTIINENTHQTRSEEYKENLTTGFTEHDQRSEVCPGELCPI